MRRRGKLSWVAAAAALSTALGLVLVAEGPAQGHGGAGPQGARMVPGSRAELCRQDALAAQDTLVPPHGSTPGHDAMSHNPACAAAVAESGLRALFSGPAARRPHAAGRTVGYIPDGKLCSGNDPALSGLDKTGTDWPVTHLTAGAAFDFTYPAPPGRHSGLLRSYVTTDDWDPGTPLTWDEIDDTVVSTVLRPHLTRHHAHGAPGPYTWTATLPAGKTGRHILYTVFQPSHSGQTFYSCSDVVFDGGHGEVTGVGDSEPPTDPGEPRTCMALYNVTEEHSGGFTGEVEVMNHDTQPMTGWRVTWKPGLNTRITSVDGGVLTHHPDGTVTVANADSNATIPPDDEVMFGFTADSTGANFPIGSMGCTSP